MFRWKRAAAVAVASTLTLTGCGGDGGRRTPLWFRAWRLGYRASADAVLGGPGPGDAVLGRPLR